jgi:hypothetical protein
MSFEYQGATITARPLTIGDEEDCQAFLDYFPEGKQTMRVLWFLQFVLAADIQGEFPVPIPSASAPAQEFLDAYARYRKLPRTFPEQWTKELAAVEGHPKG